MAAVSSQGCPSAYMFIFQMDNITRVAQACGRKKILLVIILLSIRLAPFTSHTITSETLEQRQCSI